MAPLPLNRACEELAANPENRLRLTLGLRKQHGRWVVAHEHHSFPDTSGSDYVATDAGQ